MSKLYQSLTLDVHIGHINFFFSMYFINVITLHATSRIVVCIINFLHHARKYVKKSFVEIALVHRTKAETI